MVERSIAQSLRSGKDGQDVKAGGPMKQAFAMIPTAPGRSNDKPRNRGMTMMMDWGIPLGRQTDLLGLIAPFVDLAKIVVGTARLYDEHYLIEKLELYRDQAIQPFLGGQFLEYVIHHHGMAGVEPYCDEARRIGIDAIEVSDNVVAISTEERREIIQIASSAGLEVHGEIGSKVDSTTPDALIADARSWFEHGAQIVLVEAAELVDDQGAKRNLIEGLVSDLDATKLLFELPGPWIRGVSASAVLDLKKMLIETFGPDVNIANVMPDDVFETEAMRNGLSFDGPGRHRHDPK